MLAATIVCRVYAAARFASHISAQQQVAGGRRQRLGARRELMHRRLVVVAFVVAITLVLVYPYPIGSAPHAIAAQDATPAAASPVAASEDFSGLVDIGGRSLYLE